MTESLSIVERTKLNLGSSTTLVDFIKARCLEHRPVVLASGRAADFYLDLRKVCMDSDGARIVGRRLCRALSQIEPRSEITPPLALVGVAEGGIPLVTAAVITQAYLSDETHAPWLSRRGCWIRKEAKDHGLAGVVAGDYDPQSKYVLLEDVVTSGGSARQAIQRFREAGGNVVGVLALLHRGADDKADATSNPFADLGLWYASLLHLGDLGLGL